MNHSLNGEGYVLHEECLDPCFFGNSKSLSDSTAKRISPLLGKEFGQRQYKLTLLKLTEDEYYRNGRLKFKHPWFVNNKLKKRKAK